jgi:outer membrane receptor protein involved in Fe transport
MGTPMQIAQSRPRVAAVLLSLLGTSAAAQTPDATLPPSPAVPRAGASPSQPSAAAPNSNALEQIVVTANKRREYQRDVANSVTAISGKELARRQEISLQSLAAEVPGLSLEADDKTAVRIVLRGLNTGGNGATVASVIDDVPTNATGAQSNAAINSPNFDTYDLQRIEVLRGPQSSLYGATAEGGLIKYVTNPPDPDHYSGALEGGVDGATDGGVGGTLKGFGNFPLWDGRAALRISAWNEWAPGYVDNPEQDKTDANSAQQYGWRASLLVNPTSDLSIRLTAERQSLFSNNGDYVEVAGAALTPLTPPADQFSTPHGLVNNTALTNSSQNESAVYYANIDYDFGWASLTSITSFAYNNFKSLFDYSNLNVAPGLTYAKYLQENVYGVPLDLGQRQNSDGNKFNQEVRLTSDPGLTVFGNKFEWLAGGYYTHEDTSFLQYVDAHNAADLNNILAPAAGGQTLYGALSEWAVFGQLDYHFVPSFDVALGGRFSGNAQHSQTSDVCCVLYGPNGTNPELTSNAHDALYTVAPRWRPNDNTMFYGRIATGYRPGGPNIPVPGVPGLPTSYAPDHTINYEIGWRQDLFAHTVAIDLTAFYIDWKDVQVASIVNTPEGPFDINGNAGSAISKGVEWSFTWLPLPGLKLNAVGDYTDARLTVGAPALGAVSGDFLPYVPDVSSSVNVEYSWAAFADYTAYVSGTWSYTGQRYTSFTPSTTVSVSHALLPGYNTGAIRAGVENQRYSLEAYVNNISDARGITYYASNGGADQTGQATFILSRIIGFTARVKF